MSGGPLPVDNPRRIPRSKARNELEQRLLSLIDEHGLSYSETVFLLAQLAAAWASLAVSHQDAEPNETTDG